MFLNPLILAGLGLVGVPVLIHLLNRHRAVTVEWGAMMLLRRVMVLRSRQIRLEDLLLMLLRCAIVALVVLAAARPTTRRSVAVGAADVGVVVAVDASMSMALDQGQGSRFQRACERARQILATVEPGAPITLALLGHEPRALLRNAGYQPSSVERALAEARPSAEALELDRCLPELLPLVKEIKAPHRELYIVTDAQQRDWQALSEHSSRALGELRGEARTRVVTVDGGGDRNLAVTSLDLAAGLPRTGSLVRYAAQVRNGSSAPLDGGELLLEIDDQVVDKRLVGQLAPGQATTISLHALLRNQGVCRVTARLSQPDGLADDNARHAVQVVRRTVRVLLIDGQPSDRPFGGAGGFIVAALAPDRLERPDSAIEVDVVPWLAMRGATVRQYDVVVLADVPDVPDEMAAALSGFVAQGGGLMICAGRHLKPSALNQKLGPSADREAVLPAELLDSRDTLQGRPDGMPVDFSFCEHPLVGPLRALPRDLLNETRVYRLLNVRPHPQSRQVLRLADGGGALLLEKPLGRGRVLLLTTTANRDWSNLAINPAFPLLLQHAVIYLTRQPTEHPLQIPEALILPLPTVRAGTVVTARGPENMSIGVVAALRDGTPTAVFDSLSRPGFYSIDAGADAPPTTVAVNVPPDESDVRTMDEDGLAGALADASVELIRSGDSVATAVALGRQGRELWPLLLALAAALLAAEMLLARRYTIGGR